MIYTLTTEHGFHKLDTDKIAKKFLDGGQLYVYPPSKEERRELVKLLESEGFAQTDSSFRSTEELIDRQLPLTIVLPERTFGGQGNVTCAACAAGAKLVMSEREFYLLYSIFKENAAREGE